MTAVAETSDDALMPEPEAPGTLRPKRTEHDMLQLLRARHAREGNGGAGEWAFMTHVRNAAGFNSTRTIDAIALSLWPSRGFELHGFEVKVSRSDWLSELADPAKSEGFVARCDRWWLVVAEGVAKAAEIPTGWGLLVAQGDKLRAVVQAPRLERTEQARLTDRSWLVCLLRSAGAVPKSKPEDIVAAESAGYAKGAADAEKSSGSWRRNAEEAMEATRVLREQVREFERAAGFQITEYGAKTGERAARAGQLVRAALDGDRQILNHHASIRRFADDLERAAANLRKMTETTP